MARRLRRPTRPVTMPILQPNAAGIDIGATEIYVCVPLASAGFKRPPAAALSPPHAFAPVG